MIALIRVLPPKNAPEANEVLAELPRHPAWRFTSFLVHCTRPQEVKETLEWIKELQALRPQTPVGMIARAEHSAQLLAGFPHRLPLYLNPDELLAGRVSKSVLSRLRLNSLEGRLFDEIVLDYPEVSTEGVTLLALISRAAHGGTLSAVAKDLGVTPQTLRRRLRRCGISPGKLVRRTRLRAFDLRIELGMDRGAALYAGGWSSHDQRRKTATRLRKATMTSRYVAAEHTTLADGP